MAHKAVKPKYFASSCERECRDGDSSPLTDRRSGQNGFPSRSVTAIKSRNVARMKRSGIRVC